MQVFEELEIEIPESIAVYMETDLFELEESTDPDALEKYLFYTPELIRQFGLINAELKRRKSIREYELESREAVILASISTGLSSHKYKNDHARLSAVRIDSEYREIKASLIDIEHSIANTTESLYKNKNLLQSLSNITQLRVSERRL